MKTKIKETPIREKHRLTFFHPLAENPLQFTAIPLPTYQRFKRASQKAYKRPETAQKHLNNAISLFGRFNDSEGFKPQGFNVNYGKALGYTEREAKAVLSIYQRCLHSKPYERSLADKPARIFKVPDSDTHQKVVLVRSSPYPIKSTRIKYQGEVPGELHTLKLSKAGYNYLRELEQSEEIKYLNQELDKGQEYILLSNLKMETGVDLRSLNQLQARITSLQFWAMDPQQRKPYLYHIKRGFREYNNYVNTPKDVRQHITTDQGLIKYDINKAHVTSTARIFAEVEHRVPGTTQKAIKQILNTLDREKVQEDSKQLEHATKDGFTSLAELAYTIHCKANPKLRHTLPKEVFLQQAKYGVLKFINRPPRAKYSGKLNAQDYICQAFRKLYPDLSKGIDLAKRKPFADAIGLNQNRKNHSSLYHLNEYIESKVIAEAGQGISHLRIHDCIVISPKDRNQLEAQAEKTGYSFKWE